MSNPKISYINRFFLSDEREDTSYVTSQIDVNVNEPGEAFFASIEASFVVYDGYDKAQLSAYIYSPDDKEFDQYVRKLCGVRDALNTLIEKCEDAKVLYEELQAKNVKE